MNAEVLDLVVLDLFYWLILATYIEFLIYFCFKRAIIVWVDLIKTALKKISII